jgi:hypothetical protein
MRRTAIVANLLVAVFFAVFLASTWLARSHLNGLARAFVTEKTLWYSAPLVEPVAEALDTGFMKKLLGDERLAAARRELDAYRADPAGFVADLTRKARQAKVPQKLHPLAEKVEAIKEKIRAYYDATLAALVADLRMFAATNLVAGLVACGLAWRSPDAPGLPLVLLSCLTCGAVVFGSYLYVDDLSFFRIITRRHLGWGYPLMLGSLVLWAYCKVREVQNAFRRKPQPEATDASPA